MSTRNQLVRLVGEASKRLPKVIEPVDVRTPDDVLDLLEEQINSVRSDPWLHPAAKAQLIGRLAGQVIKTLEVTQLADRVEALEAVLKLRKEKAKR